MLLMFVVFFLFGFVDVAVYRCLFVVCVCWRCCLCVIERAAARVCYWLFVLLLCVC